MPRHLGRVRHIRCCQGGSSRGRGSDSALCETPVEFPMSSHTHFWDVPDGRTLSASLPGVWSERQGAQEALNAACSQPQITSLGRRAEYLVGRIFHRVISFKVPNT